ncbi:phosphotransferase family protein [Kibdelosporangium aridum]|uniref:Predicted kinase, aminoglycoside phosphotransferase (APT) family n=1 Tax=Kibdelosporangium aridum TaxID=2030 RepID=A0A1W2FFS9_KIBAR|nr:phosphotransferase family protein [Kibdelosporangium aridum]SMD20895.1 Predicted kinase, aminoglycoside phosphotransferase (APT) family [Kibdelosporangium aridum]
MSLPGLDLEKLRGKLGDGPLSAELVEGGRSNLTYVVTDGTQKWVVRRPPLGHVLPTAHDMAREYRVITALKDTKVPVPGTLFLCQDTEVLGAPFYVMEFMPGVPYRSREELGKLGPERTRVIALNLIDTLADLHAVDPVSVGLGDFGRPEGYLERQLRRWGKQLDASRSRDLPGIDRLHDRLAERLPSSTEATILHGDYRLDNTLVLDDKITAVLDWEMSTLGDPLADLGLTVAYATREAPDDSVIANVSGAPGYPSTDEVIDHYAKRTGRDVSNLDWYIAFSFFKLAVITEGIYFRFSQGKTVGHGFEQVGALVEPVVAQGNATLKEN